MYRDKSSVSDNRDGLSLSLKTQTKYFVGQRGILCLTSSVQQPVSRSQDSRLAESRSPWGRQHSILAGGKKLRLILESLDEVSEELEEVNVSWVPADREEED
jgi:hypothetical protein